MKTKKKTKTLNSYFDLSYIFKSKDSGTTSANLLIKGKFATCVILSIVSAFIDIVFFSGLSRSDYLFFSKHVAAATVLSLMSIGFSFGKFFVAMQLSAIKEIQTRLKQMGKTWYKNFNAAKIKWGLVHKFLIGISIITSISLSTITIGNGVRTMEMNIKNMSEDANYLISLKSDQKSNNSDKKDLIVGVAASSIDNEKKAAEEADEAKKYLSAYKAQRDAIDSASYEDEAERTRDLDALRSKYVKLIPMVTSKNIDYTTAADIENYFKKQFTSTSSSSTSLQSYDDIIAFNKQEIVSTIEGLAAKEYKFPDGTLLNFTKEDGTCVELDIAIGKLQQAIMAWQVDTGDAGPSSKVFQLLATYINAAPSAGGMGFSEIIMMVLICLFGIVQEYLIAIFTPKSIISRKMIFHFNEYMGEDWDPNMFMLQTYKEYLDSGVMSTETFNDKAKKCVVQMEDTIADIIDKYSVKNKSADKQNEIVKKLQDEINHLKEEAKEVYSSDEKLKDLEMKIESYDETIASLNKDIEDKDLIIANVNANIDSLTKSSVEDKESYQAALNDMELKHAEAIKSLTDQYEAKIAELSIKKEPVRRVKQEPKRDEALQAKMNEGYAALED